MCERVKNTRSKYAMQRKTHENLQLKWFCYRLRSSHHWLYSWCVFFSSSGELRVSLTTNLFQKVIYNISWTSETRKKEKQPKNAMHNVYITCDFRGSEGIWVNEHENSCRQCVWIPNEPLTNWICMSFHSNFAISSTKLHGAATVLECYKWHNFDLLSSLLFIPWVELSAEKQREILFFWCVCVSVPQLRIMMKYENMLRIY